MKMEQTECSETSAYKIQTPGNYTEENIQHVMVCLSSCVSHLRNLSTLILEILNVSICREAASIKKAQI
jgi:hypothetical protein